MGVAESSECSRMWKSSSYTISFGFIRWYTQTVCKKTKKLCYHSRNRTVVEESDKSNIKNNNDNKKPIKLAMMYRLRK